MQHALKFPSHRAAVGLPIIFADAAGAESSSMLDGHMLGRSM
jgi:hypothetical protein